jgi:hypothetical protein
MSRIYDLLEARSVADQRSAIARLRGAMPRIEPILSAVAGLDVGDRVEMLAVLQDDQREAVHERMVFERSLGNRPTAADMIILAEMDGVIIETGVAIVALAVAHPGSGGCDDSHGHRPRA